MSGRLTGHFLGRVAMLLGGLGLVFLLWLAGLAFSMYQSNRAEVPPIQVLSIASREATLTMDGAVVLSPATLVSVETGRFWLQVLDERGDEMTQTLKPSSIPTHYTPGALVLDRQQPSRLGQHGIYTWVETVGDRELTFVLGQTTAQASQRTLLLVAPKGTISTRVLWILQISLVIGGGIVTLGVAWLFGRGLSKPMTHMMSWLSELASGRFAEPVGRDGRPASRTSDGKSRRKPYTTYREVFDSLDILTAELRRTEEERCRMEEARDEWIAGVTHDLRTPLTSVQGYADVLASDYEFEPEEVRRQAGIIAGQAEHMDDLLEDLNLTFRLRADALPLKRERTDLIELVRDAAVDLANDPRSAGREVSFEEPPGAGRINADVDIAWFRRALANLLVNAVVHNAEGTAVRVSVRREDADAAVCIADDGAGMDAATIGRLFDRYYRGTSTQSAAEGTGLGMAIARQIVEAHGGSVAVSSAVGQGTEVCVRLPLS